MDREEPILADDLDPRQTAVMQVTVEYPNVIRGSGRGVGEIGSCDVETIAIDAAPIQFEAVDHQIGHARIDLENIEVATAVLYVAA